MKRIIFIILNIFLAASFCKAINNPPFSLDYYNNPSPGYIFLSPHLSREFYLVDNSSVPVFIEKINRFDEFINPRIQPDGLISFFSGTKYYFMNDNYEVLDSFVLEGNYEVDFHDIIRLPNGNTAMLGRDLRVMDLSSVIQGGQKEALVIGSLIQEFDINKNLVFQWNSFDHFKITDVVPDIDPLQHSFIACHVNSIYYDTDGNIIASCRALDEIIKIDRQNGDLIWILGGKSSKSNQFHFLNDTIDGFFGFSHQHSVMKLPNGNLLLFDNGDLKPKFYSRVVEYKLDEVNKTIEKVWEYNDSFKIATYSMGNVQRLPNGNTLIGWGLNSANLTATEVRPDGSKTLEISGYQNYAVYKDSYKMHSAFLYVDESGIYNFKSDTNITNIKINVKDLIGNGYVSVEKHYYQPHNPNFAEISPLEISENRWVISYNGIKNLDATVEFNFDECTLYNIFDKIIFFRSMEATGDFYPLETYYDKETNTIKGKISGPGEFIIGTIELLEAPTAIFPTDNSSNIDINTNFLWQGLSSNAFFRFQLSYNSDFSDLLIDSSNITDNHLELVLRNGTEYYWHVKAQTGSSQSNWSNINKFITKDANQVAEDNDQDFTIQQENDYLQIKLNYNTGSIKFQIYDLIGNIVKDENYVNPGTGNLPGIFCNDMNYGVYFYKISLAGNEKYGKLYIGK